MRKLKLVVCTTLRTTSVSAEDEFDIANLPDPDTISDEQMEENFQKIMAHSDTDEDESGSQTAEGSLDESQDDENKDEDDSALEQSKNSDSEDEDNLDEDNQDSDDEDEDENSNEDDNDNGDENKDDNSDDDDKDDKSLDDTKEFSFDGIPMDATLPFEINAAGSKVKATLNELISGFQKGMGYTQSMQQIAPFRRSVGIMEDNNLTEADLNMYVELKAGNKEAIAKLLSDSKVDALDLETEGSEDYTPKDYGKDVVDPEMEQVKSTISQSEYKDSVSNALNTMPIDFYSEIESSPAMLNNLHKDIADGTYGEVMPEVQKLQTLYGQTKPTKELYVEVARRMASEKAAKANTEDSGSKENQEQKSNDSKQKRINASSGTKRKGQKSSTPVTKRIDDMTEDEFTENFKKMTGLDADQFTNY